MNFLRYLGVLCLLVTYVATGAAQSNLFYTDITAGKILRADLNDLEEPTTVLSQTVASQHALDAESGLVFWIDRGNESIARSRVDGSEKTTLLTGLTDVRGVALAPGGTLLFSNESAIERISYDGEDRTLLYEGLSSPADLMVVGDDILWSDTDDRTINRAALSGGEMINVVVTGAVNPVDIDYDFSTDRIYWIQGSNSRGGLFSTAQDGSDLIQLHDDPSSGLVVDEEAGVVFWSGFNADVIWQLDLSNGMSEEFVRQPSLSPFTLTVDRQNEYLYFVDRRLTTFLSRVDLSTGDNLTSILRSEVFRPDQLTIHATAGKMYWINLRFSGAGDARNEIVRADLDGTNLEVLVANPDISRVEGLAVDTVNNRLYWTDEERGRVSRANLDGSNVELLVTGLGNPAGITIDYNNERLFWTDWERGRITSSDLNGENTATVVDEELGMPLEIGYNPNNDRIYWVDGSFSAGIYSAAATGTNQAVERLVPVPPATTVASIGDLHIDVASNMVYYSTGRDIERTDADGTVAELLIDRAGFAPSGLFVVNGTITSVDDRVDSAPTIRYWPNPSRGVLNLRSEEQGMKAISLYNLQGQVVQSFSSLDTDRYELSLDGEGPGVYLLHIQFMNGQYRSERIIKTR